jgi:diamine N-acetyltransferase
MPDWYAKSANPPETLHGWLTLSMDEAAMKSFAPLKNASRITVGNGPLKSTSIERVIKNCLESKPPSSSAFRLRLAGKDDISIITRLVQGLADYEKEPDAVNLTEEDFIRDGLAPSNHQNQPPLFYCLLVEDQGCDSPTPYTFGMAFFWIGFQHERGRFLYLEDLFLEESYRKKGAGSLLLKTLAEVGQSLACHRLFWQALDWNTPALNFYNKIGAKVQDGVITSRYAGGALKEFAENGVALTQ